MDRKALVIIDEKTPERATSKAEYSPEVISYMTASRSEATRAAYASDWRIFVGWCEAQGVSPLPATSGDTCQYLVAQADKGLKASTLSRRLAAIRLAHTAQEMEPPTATEAVRTTLKGIRRKIGTKPVQKSPATADRLQEMVSHCPPTLRGLRDRALLLLGFAGAFRRSELAALEVSDIEEVEGGLRVHVRKSKTDQEGAGEIVPVIRGAKVCPVEAVNAWLEAAGIAEGPLFRRMLKGGRAAPSSLSRYSIGEIVKKYAGLAGYKASDFGGHSLRAGFATSAAMNGASTFRIMDVTRHRNVNTVRQYVRRAEEFEDHAGSGLL